MQYDQDLEIALCASKIEFLKEEATRKATERKEASLATRVFCQEHMGPVDAILWRLKDIVVLDANTYISAFDIRENKRLFHMRKCAFRMKPHWIALSQGIRTHPYEKYDKEQFQRLAITTPDCANVDMIGDVGIPVNEKGSCNFKVHLVGRHIRYDCSIGMLGDTFVAWHDSTIVKQETMAHGRREYLSVSVSPMGVIDATYNDDGFPKTARFFLMW